MNRAGPNTYGHDRRNPRIDLPRGSAVSWLPDPIRASMEAAKQAITHPRRLKSIMRGSDELPRSDFRERWCLVLQALVSRADLETWQVAIVDRDDPNKRTGVANKWIAENTGLSLRAVERTISEAYEIQYLFSLEEAKPRVARKTREPFRRRCAAIHDHKSRLCLGQGRIKDVAADGSVSYEGLPKIVEFTPKAFLELGTFDQMKGARDAKKKERKDAADKRAAEARAASTAALRQELANNARLARLRGAPAAAPVPPSEAEASSNAAAAWARRHLELITIVRAERTDLDDHGVRAEALRRLELEGTGPPG